MSGISLGVVVVEAAERSGSLITARLAGEQGREVFAVPGSPLDPRAAGTNNLLKQGACLVTSSRDIVETLAPILGRSHSGPIGRAAGDERKPPEPLPDIVQTEREIVVAAMGPSPVDIDELIRTTGIATRRSRSCCWSSTSPGGSSARGCGLCRGNRFSLMGGGLFDLGFLERHIDQIGEEGHSCTARDPRQTLKHRGNVFGRLLRRGRRPIAWRLASPKEDPPPNPAMSNRLIFAPIDVQPPRPRSIG